MSVNFTQHNTFVFVSNDNIKEQHKATLLRSYFLLLKPFVLDIAVTS